MMPDLNVAAVLILSGLLPLPFAFKLFVQGEFSTRLWALASVGSVSSWPFLLTISSSAASAGRFSVGGFF